MQTSFFAVLLGLSLLIILLGVLAIRKRSARGTAAEDAVPTPTTPDRPRSGIASSPVWNMVGVLAGVVGAVVSVIGLFK